MRISKQLSGETFSEGLYPKLLRDMPPNLALKQVLFKRDNTF